MTDPALSPNPFLAKPNVAGPRATLRPVTAADAEPLAQIMREPEVIRLTGAANPSNEPDNLPPLPELRTIYGQWAVADDRIVWAIIDQRTGNVVGESVLKDWHKGNRSASFRIFVGAAGRGQGIGTEATQLTINYACNTMGLQRITLEVYAFKDRAQHVYQKVGFDHEGTGRDALLFDGEWIDVHYLSCLTTDPR